MRITGIIPIWLMLIICIISVIFIIKTTNGKKNLIRKGIIVLLLFIINLRIMIPGGKAQTITNNLDVLFVIDNTISVLAEDYNGNKTRIEAIKNDAKYIVNKLNGARFSVMSFNDRTQIVTPYTKDSSITVEAIETMNTASQHYARGSSLNISLNDMVEQLKTSNEKNDRITILFFISDGEITNEDKLKSFSSAQKYVKNGAVLRIWN